MATSSNLQTAILSLSPNLYYTLTETSGTTLTNLGSTTGANLTLTGTYTLADRELITGDATKFLRLNGGYAAGSRGDLAVPIVSYTVSFILEIMPFSTILTLPPSFFSISAAGDTLATNAQILIDYDQATAKPFAFHEYNVGVNDVSYFNTMISLNALPNSAGVKAQLTIVKDGVSKTIKFYINGHLMEVQTFTNNTNGGTSTTIKIGSEGDNRPSINGTMGHVCVWSRALTEQEVFVIHNASGYTTKTAYNDLGMGIESSFSNTWIDASGFASSLLTVASKRLSIALDPLIDYTVLDPAIAYNQD